MQVGASLFFVGCYLAVVETVNVGFEDKWHAYHYWGEGEKAPSLRLSPLAPDNGSTAFLSYYGSLIQFLGSIVFLIGASSGLLGAHNLLPEDGIFSEFVMVDVMFFLGGLCFVVGAFFLVAEGMHARHNC